MLLILDPIDIIESRYSNNEKVIFFQAKENVFYYFSKGKKVMCSDFEEYNKFISYIELPVERIIKKIDEWVPIWTRWVGRSDQYELMKRDALKFIIEFGCFLKAKNIRSVIFLTGVSHHVVYSLIELACQISKVNQVFLYATVFGKEARLLPMQQFESILDRLPVGIEVSNVNMAGAVTDFIDNAKRFRPPTINEVITKVSSNEKYAKIFLIKTFFRSILYNLIINKSKRNSSFVFPDHGFFSHWSMINNQSRALNFYNSNVLSSEKVSQLIVSNDVLPLIASHYQPEATTFPEGWNYRDHVDIVLEIRRLGYKGLILYKEHPGSSMYYSKIVGMTRVGMSRSVGYYRNLLDLGCIFLPSEYPINFGLPDSVVVITITGTIALERALAGISTCCVGRPWYFGMPGIYSLKESFSPDGLIYNYNKRSFDSTIAYNFIIGLLSNKTLTNGMGIGTGVSTRSEDDHIVFGVEFDNLVNELIKRQK